MTEVIKYATYLLVLLLIAFLTLEVTMRVMEYKVFEPYSIKVADIKPESCMQHDPLTGFSLKPGEYTFEYESGYSFHTTHDRNGRRKIPELAKKGESINFYGGSLFYGYGLDDSLVFTYHLSKQIDGYDINNCAIFGQNMVTPLVLLQKAKEENNLPKVAVVSFASYNLARNVYSRLFRKYLYANKKSIDEKPLEYVFARLNDDESDINIMLDDFGYDPFPFTRYSALTNRVETIYSNIEHAGFKPKKVDSILIEKYITFCNENDVLLIFAFITDDDYSEMMLSKLKDRGINCLDMHVDYGKKEFNLMPYDNHPNGAAHQIYANKVVEYLKELAVLDTSKSRDTLPVSIKVN